MAEEKKAEQETVEKKEEVAKVPAGKPRFVHLLVLGVGGTTRNVQLVTDSAQIPKPFAEFINGFRSGKLDLIWTPTPSNPVFAIRMNSIDFYEYRSGQAQENPKGSLS
ncbi:hypothetical protein MAF45_05665 [Mesosutterella sp. OilRF-GAM-744-9]|uniref:Uncharacterized protein n=1 Tax=Mesosutterella porci TaxID=2915351 RepID=A0ABS9MQY6_9BURK|nr:hypothetical protein [Mesosutterella sp. oilRF-744-WT-GAM-9]MCG5030932.1 hypothetical protein [Mesosutterella sp. oilRF-744-WT-GAM-9]MCI6530346.1 hypothetical protein [Mesosutterella sp.]